MGELGIPEGQRPRRIRNIQELAKIAGVSAGTVSRALAGKELVNKETRERIQAIARDHGFRPNQMARRLRTQQTGVIGVVIPLGHERRQHISDPFFMTLLGHLADELTESGHDLMLSRVIPGDADWLDRIVDSGMLDGVLMIGQSDQFETIERVAEYYKPLVVWGSHREGQVHCTVGSDNFAGGGLAARRLIERGAGRLAFFGDTRGPEIEQRLFGARAAVAASGGVLLKVFPTHLSAEQLGPQIAAHLDELGDWVDGIVAATDVIAMTAIGQLQQRGCPVPDRVAVVGYDDLPLATQTVPPLTTVRQDIAEGAKAMVAALHRRIAGEDTPSVVMAPELVVRASA
ncbi:MAG: LacI family DNA-binding transcriptional regulator [Sphingomonadales bacterium]|nr:LacI family DNA-binding transcriptional regulator [Sphingomonadales bacterium]